jgi:hypothetical protein
MNWKLYIETVSAKNRKEFLEEVTWKQIHEALHGMNDKQIDYVSLKSEEKGELFCSIHKFKNGDVVFFLTFYPVHSYFLFSRWFIWLVRSIILVTGGGWSSFDEVVQTFENFYQTGNYKKIKVKI